MKLTDAKMNVLKRLYKKDAPMTATEIGTEEGQFDSSAWACRHLKPLCEEKYVKRKEVKQVGTKVKRIEYSLMAKGRKAVEK